MIAANYGLAVIVVSLTIVVVLFIASVINDYCHSSKEDQLAIRVAATTVCVLVAIVIILAQFLPDPLKVSK